MANLKKNIKTETEGLRN